MTRLYSGRPAFDWTDEAVETLKRLHDDGLSMGLIAQEMGHGLTRNAVCGKIHRLGLARGATLTTKRRYSYNRKVRHVEKKPAPKAKRQLVEAKPALAPGASLVRFMDRRSGECAHPLWSHRTPLDAKMCCGNPCPKEPESQWCEFHAAMYRSLGTPSERNAIHDAKRAAA